MSSPHGSPQPGTGASEPGFAPPELAQTLAQVAQTLAHLSAQLAQVVAQIDPDLRMVLSSAFDFGVVGSPTQEPQPTEGLERQRRAYPGAFASFWEAYPLKRDKRKALPAWERAIRRIATGATGATEGRKLALSPGALAGANAVLIAGAIRYAEDPNRLDQFTKYAEGWLNGDCWEDDPLPSRNGHVPRYDPAKATYEQARRMREVEDEASGSLGAGGAPRSSLPPGTP